MENDLIFVAFNSRVAAMNRDTGATVWQWKSPKGSGYITLLLDGDRLIVSVMGYTYCLVPGNGQVLWYNELPGMGTGVASIASARGGSVVNLEATAAADAASSSNATMSASAAGTM